MVNFDGLCMGCMERKDAKSARCPHCGFEEDQMAVPPHHLPYRTLLNQKYLVGRALGEGGFGITYLAWDCNLQIKVALKEYYPDGIVRRDTGENTKVFTFTGKETGYHEGREKFLQEAQRLAKFDGIDGVVKVRDFFRENNTSYIVMEYLDGVTLKQYLKQQGGRIPFTELCGKMKPVLGALEQIHQAGFIHRDISPDNIMVLKSGKLKLLDFGAAREFAGGDAKTLSVMLKPGYAPKEQYISKGGQGAWTDIYSLCATWYKCLSGETPPEALERLDKAGGDPLRPLNEIEGVRIGVRQARAIGKGMSVQPEDRYQTIKELERELYREEDREQHTVLIEGQEKDRGKTILIEPEENEETKRDKGKTKKKKSKRTVGIKIAAVFVLLAAGIGALSYSAQNQEVEEALEESQGTGDGETEENNKGTEGQKETGGGEETEAVETGLKEERLEFEDGSYYIGETKDGKPEGTGVCYYATDGELTGNYYEGEFKNGVRSGEGTFYWVDGEVYTGNWENDMRNGEGIYTWVEGDTYKGNWIDNNRNGYGEYEYVNGALYKGNYEDNMRNGYGEMQYVNGTVYKGHYENDVENGYGEMQYSSGNLYKGNWENGEMNGEGTFYWKDGGEWDGDVYEGNWENGERNGEGTYTWANGDIYEGNWENGEINGYGVKQYANGNIYEGNWANGEINGEGTFYWKDGGEWNGDVYEGNWTNGKINGEGTYTWANGDIYTGNWKNGKRNGYGEMKYANGEVYTGNWENSTFIG